MVESVWNLKTATNRLKRTHIHSQIRAPTSTMSYFDDIDQRQLKRGKFGPLDVYPQEEKQKEVSIYLRLN